MVEVVGWVVGSVKMEEVVVRVIKVVFLVVEDFPVVLEECLVKH